MENNNLSRTSSSELTSLLHVCCGKDSDSKSPTTCIDVDDIEILKKMVLSFE